MASVPGGSPGEAWGFPLPPGALVQWPFFLFRLTIPLGWPLFPIFPHCSSSMCLFIPRPSPVSCVPPLFLLSSYSFLIPSPPLWLASPSILPSPSLPLPQLGGNKICGPITAQLLAVLSALHNLNQINTLPQSARPAPDCRGWASHAPGSRWAVDTCVVWYIHSISLKWTLSFIDEQRSHMQCSVCKPLWRMKKKFFFLTWSVALQSKTHHPAEG